MSWQDLVLSTGTVVFIFALLPSIFSTDKPAVATSLSTGSVLAVFTFVYFSLELWFGAATTSITAVLWFVLAIQKYKSQKS
jgi:hypothetical protein